MEAVDATSQQGAAAVGMTTRLSAAEYGGAYLPAASQTIAEGIGNYQKTFANNIAIAKLVEYLPLVYIGDMTGAEALDAAADDYVAEATAQGFIEG